MIINGKTFVMPESKFNDVNTDEILSGPYLRVPEEELGDYAFKNIIPNFKDAVNGSDILVAGRNMGCGSSREQAPKALIRCGIKLVIAHSFGYIFYRNSINLGMALLKVEDENMLHSFKTGQNLEVDLKSGNIVADDGSIMVRANPCDGISYNILACGGLLPYLKKTSRGASYAEV